MDPRDQISNRPAPTSALPVPLRSMNGTGGNSPTSNSGHDQEQEQEQDYDQHATAIEEHLNRITDGFFAVDTEWCFTYLNDHAEELINPGGEDLIGETLWDKFPAALESDFEAKYRYAMENQVPVSFEAYYPEPLDTHFAVNAYPSETGLSVYFRDVTDKRRLESHVTELHDRITDAFISLDTDARVQHMNSKAEELLMVPEDQLLGEVIWEPFPDVFEETFKDDYWQAMETQEVVDVERYYPLLDKWYSGRAYPSETGLSVYFRDITEQKRHEEHLERSAEAKHRLHEVAVSQEPLTEKLETVLEIGTNYFDLQYGFLADVDMEADPSDPCTFEVTAAYGFDPDDGWTYPLDETYCRAVIAINDVLWTTDAKNADWVSDEVYDYFGFDTYIGARVTSNSEPFGVVGFVSEDSRSHPFTAPEEAFIELVSQWIGYELSQAHQQARVETINECSEITRDIAHYILETDDRDAIEQAVCERLVGNDLPFEMAWIGDIRYDESVLASTYQAGDTDDYLEDITIPLNQKSSELTTLSPALRAIRTYEPQVVSDTRTDETIKPWRDAMLERDYRSAIAIPLTHNEFLYGMLAVYSPEPQAFDDDICEILGHLGTLIGHTIHTLEQEKALSEDATVFELTYWSDLQHIDGIDGFPIDALLGTDADAEGDPEAHDHQVTIERTVANGGEYRVFIHADGVVPEALIDMLAALPTVESATLVRCGNENADEREPGEPCRDCVIVAELTDDSLVARIEPYGARATDLAFASDGISLTVETPPTIDVKEFTNQISDVYPGTTLSAKKTVEREWLTPEELDQIIKGELTPRQRDVLQTAHLAGYFDRPRENSGEEVADILNISGATFSEHLRTAQNKLFSAIF